MAVITPKIVFDQTEGQAPTLDLRDTLVKRHPDLFRDPGRTYAHLIIRPRCTGCDYPCGGEITSTAWYDVWHAHQQLKQDELDFFADSADAPTQIVYTRLTSKPVATLPPPVLLSYEERLARIPIAPITDADLQFHGSRQSAEQARDAQRERFAEQNRSANARDWEATADAHAEILRTINAVKLNARQRVAVGEVRLWDAQWEVTDARKSLEALRRNLASDPS